MSSTRDATIRLDPGCHGRFETLGCGCPAYVIDSDLAAPVDCPRHGPTVVAQVAGGVQNFGREPLDVPVLWRADR